MARRGDPWAWRLTILVLAVLGASLAWYLTLWAISPNAPDAEHMVRIPAPRGIRAFYVDRFNATVLSAFAAVWGVLMLWGGWLAVRDRFAKPRPEDRR
jgi:hypothetical protein